MLSTAVSILAAVALLMPGFIVVEISAVRSARSSRSDLELALRALAYTLVIHLAFSVWTAHVVETVGPPDDWPNHVGLLIAYIGVVLLAVPVALGAGVNLYLGREEAKDGPPNLVAAVLGAGEARDAFDYAYQRWREEGVYVIVELVAHTRESPRLVGGVYGRASAVGQTPQPHDVYLEALCTVAENADGIRSLESKVEPDQGVYIPATQIARIDLVPAGPDTLQSDG